MAEEDIKVQTKVVGDTPLQVDVDKTPPKQEPDLVTKVSSFKEETKSEPTSDDIFNVNDIENIKDPQAREYALKAYKSFQRGFNQKFQDLAEMRKAFEAKKAESSNWTPERVQALLNDKTFVEAAQRVTGTNQSSDEYSALSENDKKLIKENQMQVNALARQNAELLRKQQDEALKDKYANYNSEAVDIITGDLLKGKRQATREDIWKVHDYEAAVKRAYQMGVKDGGSGISEKMGSASAEGLAVNPNPSPPKKEEGESDRDYFKRIVLTNIQKQSRTKK